MYPEENIEETSEESTFNQLELLGTDTVYQVDVKILKGSRYTGGYEYNWTPSQEDVLNNNFVEFVGIVKDTALPPVLPEEFQEIMNYALDNSHKYGPRLSVKN